MELMGCELRCMSRLMLCSSPLFIGGVDADEPLRRKL